MHLLYLLTVAIMTAAGEEEDDTFVSGIVAGVGNVVIILIAVALLLVGLCAFVLIMRYRRGASRGDSIGPVSVTEI
jgi:hypothetical protein